MRGRAAAAAAALPDVLYAQLLRQAQDEAIAKGAGLWAECGGAPPVSESQQSLPVAAVADCSPFATYEEAQANYAAHLEAQPIIDPNADGRACEVWFGVDQALPVAPPPSDGGTTMGGGGYAFPASDVDCPEVSYDLANWILAQDPSDPYRLDGDNDGIACEANG